MSPPSPVFSEALVTGLPEPQVLSFFLRYNAPPHTRTLFLFRFSRSMYPCSGSCEHGRTPLGLPPVPRARPSCSLHNPRRSKQLKLPAPAHRRVLRMASVPPGPVPCLPKSSKSNSCSALDALPHSQIGAAACKKPSRRGPRAVMGGMMSTFSCRFSNRGAMRDRGSRTATSLQERGSSPLLLHLCSHAILRW